MAKIITPFHKPAEQPVLETFVPFPFQEYYTAMAGKQKVWDDTLTGYKTAYSELMKDSKVLSQDVQYAAATRKAIQKDYQNRFGIITEDITSPEFKSKVSEFISQYQNNPINKYLDIAFEVNPEFQKNLAEAKKIGGGKEHNMLPFQVVQDIWGQGDEGTAGTINLMRNLDSNGRMRAMFSDYGMTVESLEDLSGMQGIQFKSVEDHVTKLLGQVEAGGYKSSTTSKDGTLDITSGKTSIEPSKLESVFNATLLTNEKGQYIDANGNVIEDPNDGGYIIDDINNIGLQAVLNSESGADVKNRGAFALYDPNTGIQTSLSAISRGELRSDVYAAAKKLADDNNVSVNDALMAMASAGKLPTMYVDEKGNTMWSDGKAASYAEREVFQGRAMKDYIAGSIEQGINAKVFKQTEYSSKENDYGRGKRKEAEGTPFANVQIDTGLGSTKDPYELLGGRASDFNNSWTNLLGNVSQLDSGTKALFLKALQDNNILTMKEGPAGTMVPTVNFTPDIAVRVEKVLGGEQFKNLPSNVRDGLATATSQTTTAYNNYNDAKLVTAQQETDYALSSRETKDALIDKIYESFRPGAPASKQTKIDWLKSNGYMSVAGEFNKSALNAYFLEHDIDGNFNKSSISWTPYGSYQALSAILAGREISGTKVVDFEGFGDWQRSKTSGTKTEVAVPLVSGTYSEFVTTLGTDAGKVGALINDATGEAFMPNDGDKYTFMVVKNPQDNTVKFMAYKPQVVKDGQVIQEEERPILSFSDNVSQNAMSAIAENFVRSTKGNWDEYINNGGQNITEATRSTVAATSEIIGSIYYGDIINNATLSRMGNGDIMPITNEGIRIVKFNEFNNAATDQYSIQRIQSDGSYKEVIKANSASDVVQFLGEGKAIQFHANINN